MIKYLLGSGFMEQEKIGKFILDLRKKNGLTQKDFAEKFGVTFQAVSKWENGKNIPDISILKQICEEFNIDINEILDVKNNIKKEKDNSKYYYIIPLIVLIIILIVIIILGINNKKEDNGFEFKTIEANCENFNIYGNMAYNSNNSYLSISKVEYCGNNDDNIYTSIECNLYEIEKNVEKKIGECGYKTDSEITLEEYLENIKINVKNVSTLCDDYDDLMIKIEATNKDGKITTYKIPLILSNSCSK